MSGLANMLQEDGRVIKLLDPIEQIVPEVALGPFAQVCPTPLVFNARLTMLQPTKADPRATETIGDNYFEQHPANWWKAKTQEERQTWATEWKKRKEDKEKRDRAANRRMASKTKISAMETKTATATATAGATSKDDDQAQSPDSSADDGEANSGSPKATGASAKVADVELYDEDDAPAQPLDAYGFSVPRGTAKGNNRIVGPPPVKFDEDEIGNRITRSKKDNPNHRYGQTPANPKKFYVDQNIRQCNAAKNVPEDLDQALVEKHKLHPKMGLPLPNSFNPDEPVNDWKAPLKKTNPVTFIQKPRPGTDREREMFRTTRSQWVAKADHDFDVDVVIKMHMRGLLAESGYLEVPPEPAQPEAPEVPQVIDPTLINAVQSAEALRQEEARAAAVTAHHAIYSPPPPPRANPPTPHRYDPVRDQTYRTPYAPPPAPRGELDRLADAAGIHPNLPGPMTYQMPVSPYGLPSLLPAPAPYQSMYGPPPPPPPPQQQQPPPQQQPQYPRPAPAPSAGNSRHRELRPAPPQNRPPPPPPPRGWWN